MNTLTQPRSQGTISDPMHNAPAATTPKAAPVHIRRPRSLEAIPEEPTKAPDDSATTQTAKEPDDPGKTETSKEEGPGTKKGKRLTKKLQRKKRQDETNSKLFDIELPQAVKDLNPDEVSVIGSVLDEIKACERMNLCLNWSVDATARHFRRFPRYDKLYLEPGGYYEEQEHCDDGMDFPQHVSRPEECVICGKIQPCFRQVYKKQRKNLCVMCIMKRYRRMVTGDWMPDNRFTASSTSTLLDLLNKRRFTTMTPAEYQERCKMPSMGSAMLYILYDEDHQLLIIYLEEFRNLIHPTWSMLNGQDHFRTTLCLMPSGKCSETYRPLSNALPAVECCEARCVFYFENQTPEDIEASKICILLFPETTHEVFAVGCQQFKTVHLNERQIWVPILEASPDDVITYRPVLNTIGCEQEERAKVKTRGARDVLRGFSTRDLHTAVDPVLALKMARAKQEQELAEKKKKKKSANSKRSSFKKRSLLQRLFSTSTEEEVEEVLPEAESTDADIQLPRLRVENLRGSLNLVREYITYYEHERKVARLERQEAAAEKERRAGTTLFDLSEEYCPPTESDTDNEVSWVGDEPPPDTHKLVFRSETFMQMRGKTQFVHAVRGTVVAEELRHLDGNYPKIDEIVLEVKVICNSLSQYEICNFDLFERFSAVHTVRCRPYRYIMLRILNERGDCVERATTCQRIPWREEGRCTPQHAYTKTRFDEGVIMWKEEAANDHDNKPAMLQLVACGPRGPIGWAAIRIAELETLQYTCERCQMVIAREHMFTIKNDTRVLSIPEELVGQQPRWRPLSAGPLPDAPPGSPVVPLKPPMVKLPQPAGATGGSPSKKAGKLVKMIQLMIPSSSSDSSDRVPSEAAYRPARHAKDKKRRNPIASSTSFIAPSDWDANHAPPTTRIHQSSPEFRRRRSSPAHSESGVVSEATTAAIERAVDVVRIQSGTTLSHAQESDGEEVFGTCPFGHGVFSSHAEDCDMPAQPSTPPDPWPKAEVYINETAEKRYRQAALTAAREEGGRQESDDPFHGGPWLSYSALGARSVSMSALHNPGAIETSEGRTTSAEDLSSPSMCKSTSETRFARRKGRRVHFAEASLERRSVSDSSLDRAADMYTEPEAEMKTRRKILSIMKRIPRRHDPKTASLPWLHAPGDGVKHTSSTHRKPKGKKRKGLASTPVSSLADVRRAVAKNNRRSWRDRLRRTPTTLPKQPSMKEVTDSDEEQHARCLELVNVDTEISSPESSGGSEGSATFTVL